MASAEGNGSVQISPAISGRSTTPGKPISKIEPQNSNEDTTHRNLKGVNTATIASRPVSAKQVGSSEKSSEVISNGVKMQKKPTDVNVSRSHDEATSYRPSTVSGSKIASSSNLLARELAIQVPR